jgi:sterol desaturase/sphingolipid hydroxylase (fatty acid hydroxylase superfamily)
MLNLVALLIPFFLLLVWIEWYISSQREDHRYDTGSTVMNMAIGAIDQISSLVYFVVMYFVLDFVYTHFRIFDFELSVLHWVLAFIAVDLLSYWYHRMSHEVNIFWAGHVTHHSSEFYNFSIGFRLSLFQAVNRILFWTILPVFGFSPIILIIWLKVGGVYQFFLHTEYVSRLGFLEKILITPSLHRVHHGKNDLYLDKNYGATFSIWDKIFGTFQEETEPVVYGIKSPYEDNNPLSAIGHHYVYLWETMKASTRWHDKIKIFLMPPAWTPETVITIKEKHKKNKVTITKYHKQYAFFQICCCAIGMVTLLVYKDFISVWEAVLCSGILFNSMAKSAMMLNRNITTGFAKKEAATLGLELFLVLITLFFLPKFYLLTIMLFLVISLSFLTFIPKPKVEFSNI